jgi:hypothetical protein
MKIFVWTASLSLLIAVGPCAANSATMTGVPDVSALISAQVLATEPSCVMAPDAKRTYVSCNGFSVSALSKGMRNYSAELTAPGGGVTTFVNVHSHDPAKHMLVVDSGDNWSSGRRPSPPDYYILNAGETAGHAWTASNTGGSLELGGYDTVIPPLCGLFTNIQVFLGNIKSQLSGHQHGRLVHGGTCQVAGINGSVYAIIKTIPAFGQSVHSVYCVGAGGGPLLSMTLFLPPQRVVLAWTVIQAGQVPVQSPPRPLIRQ